MGKEVKTNAMRILDRQKIPYQLNTYECGEFIDGVTIADQLGQSYDMSFKTLVMIGKSRQYYVFALPVDKEVDMKKAAKAVGEKSVEMLPVKDINKVTDYIRGGCTPIGMKKQFPTVVDESAADLPGNDRQRWQTGRTDYSEAGGSSEGDRRKICRYHSQRAGLKRIQKGEKDEKT